MQLPTDGSRPLQHALERRLEAGHPDVADLASELGKVTDAVESAFVNGMRDLMARLPGTNTMEAKAERAMRGLIVDAVLARLDAQMDLGDLIRRDG